LNIICSIDTSKDLSCTVRYTRGN